MINRVTLVGRLGADVDLRYTASTGTPVARLRVATDGSYLNANGERVEVTDWHSVIVYGRNAENCATYIGKGSLVYIEGFLRTRKWTDKDGIDRYVTEVICRRIRFLERRADNQAHDAVPPVDEAGLPEVPENMNEAVTETF